MDGEKAGVCFPVMTQIPCRDIKENSTILDHDGSKSNSNSNLHQHQLELGQCSNSKVGVSKAKKRQHYSCRYCNKKFSTFQALGGHQNGHKYEKAALASQPNRSMVDDTKLSRLLYPPAMEAPLHPSNFNENNVTNVEVNPYYYFCYFSKSYAATTLPLGTMNPPQTAVPVAVPQLRMVEDHINYHHIHRAGNGRFQPLDEFNGGNSNYVPLCDLETKNDSSDHMKSQQPENLELDLTLKL